MEERELIGIHSEEVETIRLPSWLTCMVGKGLKEVGNGWLEDLFGPQSLPSLPFFHFLVKKLTKLSFLFYLYLLTEGKLDDSPPHELLSILFSKLCVIHSRNRGSQNKGQPRPSGSKGLQLEFELRSLYLNDVFSTHPILSKSCTGLLWSSVKILKEHYQSNG